VGGSLTNQSDIEGGAGGTGGDAQYEKRSRGYISLSLFQGIDGKYGGSGSAGGTGGAGAVVSTGATLTNLANITGGNGGRGGDSTFHYYNSTLDAYTATYLGTAGGAGGAGGVGVYLSGDTLVTAGMISGGTSGAGGSGNHQVARQAAAVQFGTGQSTLVVDAGAAFSGDIAGFTGGDTIARFRRGLLPARHADPDPPR